MPDASRRSSCPPEQQHLQPITPYSEMLQKNRFPSTPKTIEPTVPTPTLLQATVRSSNNPPMPWRASFISYDFLVRYETCLAPESRKDSSSTPPTDRNTPLASSGMSPFVLQSLLEPDSAVRPNEYSPPALQPINRRDFAALEPESRGGRRTWTANCPSFCQALEAECTIPCRAL